MKRWGWVAVFLCTSYHSCLIANPLDWVEAWYDIEVIVFVQPNEVFVQESEGEELLVEGPSHLGKFTGHFQLNEDERHERRNRSTEVDLESGTEMWFFSDPAYLPRVYDDQSNSLDSTPYEFPSWLLPPGESYEPFLVQVLNTLPFGEWYMLELLNKPPKRNLLTEVLPEDGEEIAESELTEPDELQLLREEFESANEDYKKQLEGSSLTPDWKTPRLVRTKQRLTDNGYQVIAHFHWHQLVPELGSDEKILFNIDHPALIEGFFGLERGRFLHLLVNLWLHPSNSHPNVQVNNPVYMLEEKRRVNRSEVNYFDHPKFGVLAEVKKINPPQDLVDLLNAIQ